ncbi:MAG: T9SS type A sorting domain-containing protein [Bacteroidota bacterium]
MNLFKNQFFLSSFFIVVSTLSLLAQSNLPGCSRTYTDNVDFDEGLLLSVNYNVPGTLRLDQPGQPLPFVYIPCSARGTVVRINAETGEITGEFASAPDGRGKDPSRTTVDEFGNVWVSNRAENGIINGAAKGSVIRIGIVIGGTRANADGTPNPTGQYLKPPFLYNTCIDRNGDGLIKTSRGLGNILPWTNAGGVDTDGGVETAEDEAITVYTRVFATGARTVAVDANGDIWVGGSSNRFHEKLNGTTGEPISGTVFNTGTGGYGGLIDGNGFLWSAGAPGNPILKYNTVTGASTNISGNGNYGLGIDPNTGEIWSTDLEGNRVVKMTPSGAIIGSYPHGNFYAQGVGVDAFGNVWVAHSLIGPSTTIGHLRTDGTYVGNVQLGPQGSGPIGIGIDNNGKIWTASINGNTAQRIDPNAGPIGGGGFPIGAVDLTVNLGAGAGPYTYSDMTGFVAINATVPSGSWTVVRDGQVAGRKWGKITWNADTPPQTGIRVEARASDNLLNLALTPFVEVQNGVEFCCAGVTGRYVEIRTNLFRGISVNTTPVLYDLTIECCDIYPNTPPQIISSNGCGTNNILLIPAGQTSSFTLTAADADMNQGVTINALGLPTGATMTPNIPVVGNPVSSTFSWTPTTNQLGEYTVRFTANDIYCYQAICEKKIQVVPCPQISGVVTNPTCPNSNTGSIVTSVLGGTPPYTYLWSNGKTTKNLINITAGSYSVTVTCTNGFTGTKQFTLTNPPLLLASLNCPVACFNQCNGQATVTASGGTPGYTYQWSGPNGYTAGNVSTISNLCPGSYKVTVTDSKGCKRIVSGTVTQNPQIVINQTITPITCQNLCNGIINSTVTGGLAPYVYAWNNSLTTKNISNLCFGTYSVTVTDAKGCKAIKSVTLLNPAPCNTTGSRLDDSLNPLNIMIYPNPTNNLVNLLINTTLETQTNIRITDLLGRVVLEQTEDLIAGSNTITYNISDFAKGVYLIQVSNGNEQKVFKLVKE